MSRPAYAALAFLIWLAAAIIYFDAQQDLAELGLVDGEVVTNNTKGE